MARRLGPQKEVPPEKLLLGREVGQIVRDVLFLLLVIIVVLVLIVIVALAVRLGLRARRHVGGDLRDLVLVFDALIGDGDVGKRRRKGGKEVDGKGLRGTQRRSTTPGKPP